MKRVRIMNNDRRKKVCRQFGDRLRSIRLSKGLTYADFDERSGIDPGNLRKYENGIREPGLVVLVIMAEALGVSYEELVRIGD